MRPRQAGITGTWTASSTYYLVIECDNAVVSCQLTYNFKLNVASSTSAPTSPPAFAITTCAHYCTDSRAFARRCYVGWFICRAEWLRAIDVLLPHGHCGGDAERSLGGLLGRSDWPVRWQLDLCGLGYTLSSLVKHGFVHFSWRAIHRYALGQHRERHEPAGDSVQRQCDVHWRCMLCDKTHGRGAGSEERPVVSFHCRAERALLCNHCASSRDQGRQQRSIHLLDASTITYEMRKQAVSAFRLISCGNCGIFLNTSSGISLVSSGPRNAKPLFASSLTYLFEVMGHQFNRMRTSH